MHKWIDGFTSCVKKLCVEKVVNIYWAQCKAHDVPDH